MRTPRGVRLHAREVGRGPDLVLHHGLASSQRIWDPVLRHLAPRFHVVTYDARGHGLSTKPTSGYGFPTTTEDLLAGRPHRGPRPPPPSGRGGSLVGRDGDPRGRGAPPARVRGHLPDRRRGRDALPRDVVGRGELRLSPPALDGMDASAFRAIIPTFWDGSVPVTPELEAIVLSLMRIDRAGQFTRDCHVRTICGSSARSGSRTRSRSTPRSGCPSRRCSRTRAPTTGPWWPPPSAARRERSSRPGRRRDCGGSRGPRPPAAAACARRAQDRSLRAGHRRITPYVVA